MTNPEQVEAMMKTIGEKFGGLDILINNSGIIRDRTIKKLTLEDFESVVRVNLDRAPSTSRRRPPPFCARMAGS